MRAAVQRVKKYISATYIRDGVFGNDPERQENGGQQVAEWDDIVCVMSPEEAEVFLQVFQLVGRSGALKVPADGPFVTTAGEAKLRRSLISSAMIKGLESDLRKLKRGNGEPVFEEGIDPRDLWRLTPEVRTEARRADPAVSV